MLFESVHLAIGISSQSLHCNHQPFNSLHCTLRTVLFAGTNFSDFENLGTNFIDFQVEHDATADITNY